jgi:LuxR family maltose regulon positive regulatory protein
MSMTVDIPSAVGHWPSAWEDTPSAALDAIEASLRRGDTRLALDLLLSVQRCLPQPGLSRIASRSRLSDRELDALALLPDATLSQKDIARTMGITSNTLKTHLRSLYLKLGVHSRAEAIELARPERAQELLA